MKWSFSQSTGLIPRNEFIEKVSDYEYPRITNNKKIAYYNIPAAFDIEVSSFYYNRGEKCACMYIWIFGIGELVTFGRTWDEWTDFISQLTETLLLSDKNRLVVYIHNFAYEFQFIRKRVKWDKLFFLERRKPIYGIANGIEYRCSFKLSGKSLANVGKDLQKYKCRKAVGDLDYSLVRTSETQLTEEELYYCEMDIRVLLCYIQEKIETDKNVTLIPYTNTGYVRNKCRKECLGRWDRYSKFIHCLTLEPEEYELLKKAFAGGFTHASAKYSRKTVKNVGSFDFTSSYPSVMLLERFPMSKGKRIENLTEEQFENYLKYKCCLITATFSELIATLDYDHPISSSKMEKEQAKDKRVIKDNGRVVYAPEATLSFTEVDYEVFKRFYRWDKMTIHSMYVYDKDYLPRSFVSAIIQLYKDKTELKDVDGEEVNYMISKNMLNSAYGMIVTDIVRDLILYQNDLYSAEEPVLEDAIKAYNESIKRFLFYPWGVWVTAYSRRNLFTGIVACGEDYIYSDTDSIKVRNWKKHMDYIDTYNENIKQKIRLAAKYFRMKEEDFSPLNKKGKAKTIGVWDFEGEYKRFKTVGAKRYIIERHEKDIDEEHGRFRYSLTVAGVNKTRGMQYLEKSYADPFDGLNEGLIIPGEYSGRLLLDYCGDRPCEGEVVDYLGNTGTFSELSYIHMEPTTYELTYSADYKAFIDNLMEVVEYGEYV